MICSATAIGFPEGDSLFIRPLRDGPDPLGSDQSPPVVFGKKAGSMLFSVVYVLIGALVFWLILVGLRRLLWTSVLLSSGPGAEPTIRMTPSASSPVVLAYAIATSKVNSLGEMRR